MNISSDLNRSRFVQYHTESRSVGSNTRLRWTVEPAGDLLVVYKNNLTVLDTTGASSPTNSCSRPRFRPPSGTDPQPNADTRAANCTPIGGLG
ncbi:MAG TPA: hypothetical protein VGQ17_11355 [Gemmatimonadales bacterium]|nr:hypothetical protein [Gemmatimonadales bacterium]